MLDLATPDWRAVSHHDLLAEVRRAYPLRTQCVNGINWSLIDSDRDAQTVLLLPGALGVADTAFHYILAFAPRYRVISLDYPPAITHIDQLLAGIAILLAEANAGPVHLVGGSYSGPIAHLFARRHPTQVRSLVFGDSGLPQRWRTIQMGALLGIFLAAPLALIRWTMQRSMGGFLADATPVERFWQQYFTVLLRALPRTFFTSRARLFLSLIGQPNTTDWQGPVLIVDAADDNLFNPRERQALRVAYPQARQYRCDGHGHGSALTIFHEHIKAYAKFWEDLEHHA
jgi:pimeloyl-ACP methyl ester carboxylesterase